MIGPTIIETCIKCECRTLFRDWKDGDYNFCNHPEAKKFAPKTGIQEVNIITPNWCPARPRLETDPTLTCCNVSDILNKVEIKKMS